MEVGVELVARRRGENQLLIRDNAECLPQPVNELFDLFSGFDELCIAAAKATSAINKVRLLEKAASLYQGKLLSAANGEHWLVHYANRYHLAFMSTVNELLKQLMDFHAYDLLHRDAALALTIAPENTKAYYWLIRSYQKQHMDEMAAGELAAAKQKLPEDEYQKLLISLER